jgi:hypothetical protein
LVANPSESNLYVYSITLGSGTAGGNNSTYNVTGRLGTYGAQTVTSPSSSAVLSSGVNFTVTGQTDVQTYIGTAYNASGAVIGFIFQDSTTGTYYLFSTNSSLPTGKSGVVTLHISTGVSDPNQDNWNLSTGAATAYCFTEGTMIATPEGETAVETLKPGDLVLTASGETKPVRWLGRSIRMAPFCNPLVTAPIRIRKEALGEGAPARDLRLSPCHAIFIQGMLIQASALVNGTSVIREAMPGRIAYYHVELERHDLLLAEGVASESFVDNVDRMNFDNWSHRETPDDRIAEMAYPRVKSARQMPQSIRNFIAERAAQMAPVLAVAG